jgi:hypothetical protein
MPAVPNGTPARLLICVIGVICGSFDSAGAALRLAQGRLVFDLSNLRPW